MLRFVALVATLVVFALYEGSSPRKTLPRKQLRQRWPANLGLMLLNQAKVTWGAAVATVALAWWAGGEEIGLRRHVQIGFWTATLLTFELISCAYHWLLHSVPVLWHVHAVHHCDTEIDFTTTFRNHLLELLFMVPISIPIVVSIGFPSAAIVLYQLIRTLVLVFAHAFSIGIMLFSLVYCHLRNISFNVPRVEPWIRADVRF